MMDVLDMQIERKDCTLSSYDEAGEGKKWISFI